MTTDTRRKALLLLAVGAASIGLAAGASGDPCRATPAGREALDRMAAAARDCDDAAGCLREQRAALEPAVEAHPRDAILHRAYQDLLRENLEAEEWAEVVDGYRARSEKRPGDAVLLYLRGRVEEDPDVKLEIFQRSADADPDYPWARNALAATLWERGEEGDGERVREHINRFAELCPEREEIAAYLDYLDDGPRRVRAILERETNAWSMDAYWGLWAREFRDTPPDRHDALRDRIRADVERIRRLDLKEDADWWKTLEQGYKLSGDEEGLRRLQDERIARDPCSDAAVRMRLDGWHAAHPPPGPDGPAEAARTWSQELYRASAEWVEACPEAYALWGGRFHAAKGLPELPREEVEAIARSYLQRWEQVKKRGWRTMPSPYIQVARLFVERSIHLQEVPDLVQKGFAEIGEEDAVPARGEALPWTWTPADSIHWQGWTAQARAYLKSGGWDSISTPFGEMEDLLLRRRPGEEADDAAWTWHRDRAGRYWGLRAEAARARGDKLDALAFLRKARGFAPQDEELLVQAREIWDSLGGGDEAWTAWLELAGSAAGPASSPEATRWSERDEPLPPFELVDLAGATWTSRALRNKVVFVNLWATWCGPCRLELPYVQKLHQHFKGSDDVVVLTLSVDENPGLIAPFLARENLDLPVLLADEELRGSSRDGIPKNWLVDGGGVVRYEQVGFGSEGEAWLEDTKRLLLRMSEATPAAPDGSR